MCGFVGQLSVFAQEKDEQFKENFKRAVDLIIHRGPDSDGFYHDAHCSLGFRRLSIIDLEGGTQPIYYSDDRYVLIFNGEIYNYLEIKEDLKLKGLTFKTSSDSEVLVAAYSYYGKDAVKKFRGMFGFLIWDRKTETLFGARDMFGIKPFYYSEVDGVSYFASEKKSIIELTHNTEINEEALQYYFSFKYVPEPLTMNKNIFRLEPGHCFTKKVGGPMVIEEYWDADFHKDYYKTEEEAIAAIRKVLKESVGFHLRSDVPVGALLSSGIDSTITAAIAKDHVKNIKTFTIGFDTGSNNETPIAKESAKAMGVENYSMTVDAKEYISSLDKVAFCMDDPLGDPAAIALYFVTRLAGEHVTVIISGEGSDELFTGYKMYRQPLSLAWAKYIPNKNFSKKVVSKLHHFPGQNSFIKGCTDISERYISNTLGFESEKDLKRLIRNYDENLTLKKVVKKHYERVGDVNDVSKMQYVDLKMWMAGDILLKADRMSMANSLELRVPFLDKEVFEVASRIDPSWNLKEDTTKRILRKAARGIIPDIVLDRPKLGFPVPLAAWLREDDMKSWAMDLIENSATDKYINKDFVREIYAKHLAGEKDYKSELWAVLSFMQWHKLFVEEWDKTVEKNLAQNQKFASERKLMWARAKLAKLQQQKQQQEMQKQNA